MKQFWVALWLLLTPIAVIAQVIPQNGQTLQVGATGNGNGQTIIAGGYTLITYQISGTFSGTINPEASLDGINYNALTCYDLAGVTTYTSFTTAGTYRCNLSGHNIARARISGFASGNVTVNATVTAGGSASGGSSAVLVSKSCNIPGMVIVTCPPYNAKGDGMTDDTAAIQRAINSLSSGKKLLFPSAVYAISSTLIMTSKTGIIISGSSREYDSGSSTTLLWKGAVGGTMMEIDNTVRMSIEKLEFNTTTGNQASKAIYFHASTQSSGSNNVENINCSTVTDCIYIDATNGSWDVGGYWIKRNRTDTTVTNGVHWASNANFIDRLEANQWFVLGAALLIDSGGSPNIIIAGDYTFGAYGIKNDGQAYIQANDWYSEDTQYSLSYSQNYSWRNSLTLVDPYLNSVPATASISVAGNQNNGTGINLIGGFIRGAVTANATKIPVLNLGTNIVGAVSVNSVGMYTSYNDASTTGSEGYLKVRNLSSMTGSGLILYGDQGILTNVPTGQNYTFEQNGIAIGVWDNTASGLQLNTVLKSNVSTGTAPLSVASTTPSIMGVRSPNAGELIGSSVPLTNGSGAGAGTITNAPVAGNPTKWIPINDNGTTRYIPAW